MMSSGNSSSNNNSTAAEAGSAGLKKGPWTAAEDAILIDYVKKNGEGNWNSVQKNSGLMRCGKSCRLRWANHLRPNLKKGSFTPEEERVIIDLHSKLGNKWARMASQLPGRTDNEIKNYWNTRMKRRQRAGLPIYPQEVQEEPSTFNFQQQGQQKHPSSSFASLSSSRKPTYNASRTLLDPIKFSAPLDPLQNHLTHALYSNQNHQFKFFGDSSNNNRCLALPLSPISPYARSPSSTTLFNQNHAAQPIPATPPPLPYNAPEFENNMSFTSLIMGAQVDPNGFIPILTSELNSDQAPLPSTTPVSYNSGGVCVVEASGQLETEGNSNSGLLDALLQEAKNLACKGKWVGETSSAVSDKGKRVLDESTMEEQEAAKHVKLSLRNGSEFLGENPCDDLSSSQSSIGTRPSTCEEAVEENALDDDLLSLLHNFQSSEPLPEWYHGNRNEAGVAGDGQGVVVQQDVNPADADPNLNWALGTCHWNNMPGIC